MNAVKYQPEHNKPTLLKKVLSKKLLEHSILVSNNILIVHTVFLLKLLNK